MIPTQTNRGILQRTIAILFVLVGAMWSWNEIASLFGLPAAHLRHVAAAAVLLTVVRMVIYPSGRQGRSAHDQ